MRFIVAVDIGGTFTDLVAYEIEEGEVIYSKSSTTYDNLVEGVFSCLEKAKISIHNFDLVKHGSTLVINSLIQRNGAKTALITTKGFRDTLEIGRGNRPLPFDLRYRRDPALIPRPLRFEVGGRVDGKGKEIEPLDIKALEALAAEFSEIGIEALAISFLNSYISPEHERIAANTIRKSQPKIFVSTGTELSREWSEYERTATVCANAYVGPALNHYIKRLEGALQDKEFNGKLYMMGSNGGLLTAKRARKEPVTQVESGPVGGCIGAAAFAQNLGYENVIAFDMGGTTAKCALVVDGRFSVENATYIGGFERGFPIRASVIDIVEIGTGGGSIAWLDKQKRLNVGPKSAGADPGPACYGLGGENPTVTDANLILGRLSEKNFLGGDLRLDVCKSNLALKHHVASPLGYDEEIGLLQMADGVIAIAVMHMASAIRKISIERGLDPRDFVLMAYGGGGPLHAMQLARDLHIPTVVIPPEPGNFSATGMLLANARVDTSRTFLRKLDDQALMEITKPFEEMRAEATDTIREESDGDIGFEIGAEIRYQGQKHSIRIDMEGLDSIQAVKSVFFKQYRSRYGHADEQAQIEFVGLQLAAMASTPGPNVKNLVAKTNYQKQKVLNRPVWIPGAESYADVPIYDRSQLGIGFKEHGPAIIEEYGSTTLIGREDTFTIGKLGEIQVDCNKSKVPGCDNNE